MTNGRTRRPFRHFQRCRHRFRLLPPPSCEKLPVQKCLAQLILAVFHLLASPLSPCAEFCSHCYRKSTAHRPCSTVELGMKSQVFAAQSQGKPSVLVPPTHQCCLQIRSSTDATVAPEKKKGQVHLNLVILVIEFTVHLDQMDS